MNKRGATAMGIIIGIGIVVVLGLLLYMLTAKNSGQNSDTATTTTSVASSTSLTTYSSNEYGFTMQYPSNLEATSTFQGFQHVATSWRQGAVGSPETGKPVVAIIAASLRNKPEEEGYYFDSEVRVGVGSSTDAVNNCTVRDQDEDTATTSIMLGGVSFTRFIRQSAGMSQYGMVQSYRAVHQKVCYAIESIVAGGGTAPNNPSQSADLKTQQQQLLDSIIQTFSFTK
jgi:hypothetical protein